MIRGYHHHLYNREEWAATVKSTRENISVAQKVRTVMIELRLLSNMHVRSGFVLATASFDTKKKLASELATFFGAAAMAAENSSSPATKNSYVAAALKHFTKPIKKFGGSKDIQHRIGEEVRKPLQAEKTVAEIIDCYTPSIPDDELQVKSKNTLFKHLYHGIHAVPREGENSPKNCGC